MISTLLDRLFQRSNVPSGAQVKQRLKFILAHDRAAIEPQVFENMRHEIMRVVSRYVELDEGALDIRLESDKRMTALIANLPIRMVREELPDLVSLFDNPDEETSPNQEELKDSSVLEMDLSAEAALDAIAAKDPIQTSEDISPSSIALVAERTTEVSIKLRSAATKAQNVEANERVVKESDRVETQVSKDVVNTAVPTENNLDTAVSDISNVSSTNVVADKVAAEGIVAVNASDVMPLDDLDDKDEAAIEESSDQLELSFDVPSSSETI
ncbi:cell division topological specificity factor MinE [Pseudanabaena sp. 'Roaring Creek']|uniref:cell division topological specificity factor MinE n=1 Tax=Pseudanabaena sp. 'Roaring Creek' TaxID=1681830 RepID=UPI00092F729D|nr:cell division topological specificity factor MinE [Pseudanabaena sp. 'Roaring Creek']